MGKSEGAVDLGGPTREFLRLAIREMFETSGMFGGEDKNKVALPNSQARSERHYYMCGKLFAVSLCNGGVVGNCLSKTVFQFLVNGDSMLVNATVDEIPDYEVRTAVGELAGADLEKFPHALENVSAYLEQCGYSKIQSLDNKEDMVKELCHFFVIDRVRSALEQLRQGLATLDVLSLLKRHPLTMEKAFCAENSQLCAVDISNLFLPVLDEPGSNKHSRQELIVMHWRDYLQDCEACLSNATLGEVLTFATGSDEIPPLGFHPIPQIQFWEDVRPKANTCANTLYLPLFPCTHGEIAFEEFKAKMDEGILNSPSFGLA